MSGDIRVRKPYGDFNPAMGLSEEQLIQCMRCGLCLPTCPTYSLYGLEKASPRGRLALMRAAREGQLEISEGFHEAMNLCLGCLACMTACPAGVEYGHLLEAAREQSEQNVKQKRSVVHNQGRYWVLNRLVYDPRGLEPLMPFLRIYQSLGLQRLNIGRLLPGSVGDWERMLPHIEPKSTVGSLGEFVPANPPVRGRVGLLAGCIENTLLSKMGIATAHVLAYNGFEVVIPKGQVCCGALAAHVGEMELARDQAIKNILAFEEANVEVVISDAAGCSYQLKEYGYLFAGDPEFAEKAKGFSERIKDITEFLVETGPLRDGMHPLKLRVAYDDPCHLIHGQGISTQPRQLIESIPGVELVNLPEADWCCGSAGIYNLSHIKESQILLKRKISHVKDTGADVLATANTGCYLQLAAGIRAYKLEIEVVPVVQLLGRAYGLL